MSNPSQHEGRRREQLTTIERNIETAAGGGRRGTRTPDIFLLSLQNFLPQLLTDSVALTFGTRSVQASPLSHFETQQGTPVFEKKMKKSRLLQCRLLEPSATERHSGRSAGVLEVQSRHSRGFDQRLPRSD